MLFFLPLQLCHIDCQAEGGIPSYSFALMVIFFLQQRKEPLLPVYLGRWVIPCGSRLSSDLPIQEKRKCLDLGRKVSQNETCFTLSMCDRWKASM